jgi:histidinol-phosphate phosphatase family protein
VTRKRYVALDRDGTIIVERHYLSDPNLVELLPGAAAGLRELRALGFGLVVVTNQSAIGRGFFDQAQLGRIHARLEELLEAEGVRLDGIYACPHLPDDACACRKPNVGLLEAASQDLGFDAAETFVIGDNVSDIQLGRRAGATTILVRTGYGAAVADAGAAHADHVVDDLVSAAKVVRESLPAHAAGGNR